MLKVSRLTMSQFGRSTSLRSARSRIRHRRVACEQLEIRVLLDALTAEGALAEALRVAPQILEGGALEANARIREWEGLMKTKATDAIDAATPIFRTPESLAAPFLPSQELSVAVTGRTEFMESMKRMAEGILVDISSSFTTQIATQGQGQWELYLPSASTFTLYRQAATDSLSINFTWRDPNLVTAPATWTLTAGGERVEGLQTTAQTTTRWYINSTAKAAAGAPVSATGMFFRETYDTEKDETTDLFRGNFSVSNFGEPAATFSILGASRAVNNSVRQIYLAGEATPNGFDFVAAGDIVTTNGQLKVDGELENGRFAFNIGAGASGPSYFSNANIGGDDYGLRTAEFRAQATVSDLIYIELFAGFDRQRSSPIVAAVAAIQDKGPMQFREFVAVQRDGRTAGAAMTYTLPTTTPLELYLQVGITALDDRPPSIDPLIGISVPFNRPLLQRPRLAQFQFRDSSGFTPLGFGRILGLPPTGQIPPGP